MRPLLFFLGIGAMLGVILAPSRAPTQELADVNALRIGTDAYIYGYPLVTMEVTRRMMTNVPSPMHKLAPMGQFANLRTYPSPDQKTVTTPNADTLYSSAWIDLTKEPYILSIPDANDRYFMLPLLDAWSNVFQAPGKRTTGTKAQAYAITGPKWTGELPDGLTPYRSPTSLVWILGRTYCTGTADDYRAVHLFQDGLSLVPLSEYGKAFVSPRGPHDPAIDMKTPLREQVHQLDADKYFRLLASLLKDNPPTAADAPIVEQMAKIGIVPGKMFDISKLAPEVAEALREVPKTAQAKIHLHTKDAGTMIDGWFYLRQTGNYGTNYLQRAFVTSIAFGANRPEDTIYPMSHVDSAGKLYSGADRYVLHFAKGQMPPARGLWSLTMYDSEFFFVPNTLNRYTLSSRFDFRYNADGSLDLYIQKDSPGKEKESNWLPAPAGKFILMMRLFWPSETPPSIIDWSWKIPPVNKVD